MRLSSRTIGFATALAAAPLSEAFQTAFVSPSRSFQQSRTPLCEKAKTAAAVEAVERELQDFQDGEQQVQLTQYEAGSHDELMYAFGVSLGRQLGDIRPLVEDGEELSVLAKGVLDVVVGRLDEVQVAQLLVPNKERLSAILAERTDNIKRRLEESGKAMLSQMRETEGVFVLDTGVVVHPLECGPDGFGAGARPTAASSVKVHYHGTLPDGTVFDSSLGRDPVTFALAQVIPGWKQALQYMHEGETAMIGIPPDQGYGEMGSPDGRIPGGATLFFKVQLLEVLTAGVGGDAKLLGPDGRAYSQDEPGLLGADGRPMY